MRTHRDMANRAVGVRNTRKNNHRKLSTCSASTHAVSIAIRMLFQPPTSGSKVKYFFLGP